jgi:hypothetical protein
VSQLKTIKVAASGFFFFSFSFFFFFLNYVTSRCPRSIVLDRASVKMHWAASSQPERPVYTARTMYIIDRRERELCWALASALCVYIQNYMVYISALQQKGAQRITFEQSSLSSSSSSSSPPFDFLRLCMC